jgi:hypothetical protein
MVLGVVSALVGVTVELATLALVYRVVHGLLTSLVRRASAILRE